MKRSVIIILFVILCVCSKAQQIGMYSHYFFKPMVYNPAFTGYEDATNAMLLTRSQWTGIKGSPQLNLFTLDGSLLNNKVGLGVTLISDRKGLTNRIGGNIGYSYRLNINDKTYLRFGISLGIIDQTIDYSKALVEDSSDPVLFAESQRKTIIDGNAGLAFIWKGLELGVAVPQLFGNKINYVDNTNVRLYYSEVRHYLGTLKYKFILSKEKGISISPLALVRFVPNTPFQYDGSITVDWKDKLWIGATYKSDYAIGLNAGVCIHKQFYVGYSYDIITSSIGKYSGISHEIMMNFKFGKSKVAEPEKIEETPVVAEDKNQKRLDSLQTELAESQIKIKENEQKLRELSNKLDELKVQQTQNPANQNISNNQNPVQNNANEQISGNQKITNNQNTSDNQVNTNTQINKNNENQNSAAVSNNTNKINDGGIWIVTGNVKDYKDAGNKVPKKSYYVIAGTFFYRDFAQTELKRLYALGYKNSSLIYFESKQFNYVFISKVSTKEEAIKIAKDAKLKGINDAWVLQLNE